MSLSSIKAMKSERGFTIVELLIVIVVIGILAGIVIVAFNGVQNSAKLQSNKAGASNVQKKIEAYNAKLGSYPTATTYTAFTTALNGQTESAITGITLGTPATGAATEKNVGVYRCAATGGFSLTWWDPTASPAAAVTAANGIKVNHTGATCAAPDWQALT